MIDYNAVSWSEHFYVDSASPSGISRAEDTYASTGNRVLKYKAGSTVGSRAYQKSGKPCRWLIKFNGSVYAVHRIIWCLVHKEINSSCVIDHINGDPFDNNITNLRMVHRDENRRNSCKPKNNTSGLVGIALKIRGNSSSYIGTVSTGVGVILTRSFSVKKHGDALAKQLCIDWRNYELKKLENANIFYSDRHGY